MSETLTPGSTVSAVTGLTGQISRDGLMEYNRQIAKWVRISGLPEERESLSYIQKLLDGFGYRIQILDYPAYISYPVKAFVSVEAPELYECKALGGCFTPSTPVGGVVAEAVNGKDRDYRGKIAVFEGMANPGALRAVEERGAVGVIFIHDENTHNFPVGGGWGSPEPENTASYLNIPVVAVTRPEGRRILELLERGHVTLRLESEVSCSWRICPLLIADLPAKESENFVLYSGHIDSWDYGAMDNGSANAAMVECARVIALHREELKRGLRIAFWSGHSQGRYAGSSWYADHYFEELEAHCIAHVNIDSVGAIGAIVIEEAPLMSQAFPLVSQVVKELTGTEFIGKKLGRNSDQSFWGVGVTSLFGTFSEQDLSTVGDTFSFRSPGTIRAGGLGWWWHTEHDTMDKIDPGYLERDTKIYAGVLWRLLTDAVPEFSVSRAVEELQNIVKELQVQVGASFDFSPLLNRLAAIHVYAKRFDAKGTVLRRTEKPDAAYEYTQLQTLKALIRAAYHERTIYEFDTGGPFHILPGLDAARVLAKSLEGSSRYYMNLIKLQRGYNRIMGYLRTAEHTLRQSVWSEEKTED